MIDDMTISIFMTAYAENIQPAIMCPRSKAIIAAMIHNMAIISSILLDFIMFVNFFVFKAFFLESNGKIPGNCLSLILAFLSNVKTMFSR